MQAPIDQSQLRKIYSMNSIWGVTFLGGPLAAGYIISENFKTLGQKDKVLLTWVITSIATVIIFGGIFMITDIEKIPRQLIPIAYTAIAYFIVNEIQGDSIKKYIESTGLSFSIWRSLGVGLIWLIITIIPLIGYFYLTDPITTSSTKTYGALSHQVYFQKDNITEKEVDEIAEALTQTFFFDDEQQKGIFLEKKENKYFISIPIIDSAWGDQDVIDYFSQLRTDTQTLFQGKKIVINLCTEEDITQIKKVLE